MRPPIRENVADYQIDDELGSTALVYLTIKGFNQQAIVDKIIERKGKKSLGLTAVDDTRKRRYSAGRILFTHLGIDAFTDELLGTADSIESVEPYHLASAGDLLAYTAGDRLGVVGPDGPTTVTNDWMAYLHTADFSADRQRVLVVSTGFDTIQELDLTGGSGEPVWEWNGWDHGFTWSQTAERHYVRSEQQAAEIRRADADAEVVVVADPLDFPREGLATQETPLNLNGVFYGPVGPEGRQRVLATGYHRPELFVIDRSADGDAFALHDLGLSHPHSFRAVSSDAIDMDTAAAFDFSYHYMVSNTGGGELLLLDDEFAVSARVDFSDLPADAAKRAGFGEWLQTASFLDEGTGLVAAVDALRNGVHLVDLVGRRRRFIPNPPNWTIQTCASIAPAQVREMTGLPA